MQGLRPALLVGHPTGEGVVDGSDQRQTPRGAASQVSGHTPPCRGVPTSSTSSIVVNLAHDETLANQARVNTAQQFSESPALPNAFIDAVMGVRDRTPMLVDDIFSDADLYEELSKALPAMLYEHLHTTK